MVYPRVLAGRREVNRHLRENVEVVPRPPTDHGRLIDPRELRQLIQVCLRLEAVCEGRQSTTTGIPADGIVPVPDLDWSMENLGLRVRDEMLDRDLLPIVHSTVTRIENAISTLVSLNSGVIALHLTGSN